MSCRQHVPSKIDLERLVNVCPASSTSDYHFQFLGITEMLIHWLQLVEMLQSTFLPTLDLVLVYINLFVLAPSEIIGCFIRTKDQKTSTYLKNGESLVAQVTLSGLNYPKKSRKDTKNHPA